MKKNIATQDAITKSDKVTKGNIAGLATIVAFCIITPFALSACAPTSASERVEGVKITNGTIREFTLEPGITCDAYSTVKGAGVDCDFSSLDGVDLGDVADQEAEIASGVYVALTVLDDHLCVSLDGRRSGGLTCYYPTA